MEMTVILWCRGSLFQKQKSSHFDRFSLSETGCSCITPMRSIGQSCAVSGTLFFSSPFLFNPPICQRFSVIFSCYFCLSFSGSLSISAKRHKNSISMLGGNTQNKTSFAVPSAQQLRMGEASHKIRHSAQAKSIVPDEIWTEHSVIYTSTCFTYITYKIQIGFDTPHS